MMCTWLNSYTHNSVFIKEFNDNWRWEFHNVLGITKELQLLDDEGLVPGRAHILLHHPGLCTLAAEGYHSIGIWRVCVCIHGWRTGDHNPYMFRLVHCCSTHQRGQTRHCRTYPWLDRCKLSAGKCGHKYLRGWKGTQSTH